MPLADLLLRQFGVKTEPVENPLGVTSIGTTAERILSNNPNRLAWIVINLSANIVYLALKSDVSSSKGIRLNANGGEASMIWSEDFQAVSYEVYAVASGASSAIYVLEVQEALK
jgi:hypothetical protein